MQAYIIFFLKPTFFLLKKKMLQTIRFINISALFFINKLIIHYILIQILIEITLKNSQQFYPNNLNLFNLIFKKISLKY